MKIKIVAKPYSKNPGIELKDGIYIIRLKSKPEKGRANEEIIERLANYFKLPKKNIKILSGQKSRRKVVDICK